MNRIYRMVEEFSFCIRDLQGGMDKLCLSVSFG